MPKVSAATYKPKTWAQVRLNLSIYKEIATKTGIPLAKVMQHSSHLLNKSLAETIADTEENINKYAPKATGQIRNSLIHQLHNSGVSNNILSLKLGTYVSYMKYLPRMKESMLRHPKTIPLKYATYQRNSKHGKKGQLKRNPGQWRYVRYYGAPRWVRLEDPDAQHNFYSLIVTLMKTKLQKSIAAEIKSTFPTGQIKPWTDKFKVIT